jgi:hypothetical protein
MQAMILSAVRSTLIALGAGYFAKKGLDPSALDALVAAIIAVLSAGWGVYDKLKK